VDRSGLTEMVRDLTELQRLVECLDEAVEFLVQEAEGNPHGIASLDYLDIVAECQQLSRKTQMLMAEMLMQEPPLGTA
jgi:hypothetical protein